MKDQPTIASEELTSYAQAFSDTFLHVAKRIERAPLSNEERAAINDIFDECSASLDNVRAILKKAESWE